MMDLFKDIDIRGVLIKDCGNGHIQIKGALTVNYYPESKKRTAYVCGMVGSAKHVTAKKAVLMANEPPINNGFKSPRLKNYKTAKNKLMAKNAHCYWCDIPLTKATATLDHVIPLSRGGLNNDNNYVLACEPCNIKRGNSMPEVNYEIL